MVQCVCTTRITVQNSQSAVFLTEVPRTVDNFVNHFGKDDIGSLFKCFRST